MRHFFKISAIALVSLFAVNAALASGTSYEAPKQVAKPAAATPSLKLNKLQVQLIQYALKDLGHKPGPIDGIWGKSSSKAVKAYQASVGKSKTGSLNQDTACKLLQIGIANHGSAAGMPSWCGFN